MWLVPCSWDSRPSGLREVSDKLATTIQSRKTYPLHLHLSRLLCTRIFALLAATSTFSWATTCPPAPEPVSPASDYPIYLYRDIETCRIFTPRYDPAHNIYGGWSELDSTYIRVLTDSGHRLAFIDEQMAGTKIRVDEYFNTNLGHYFLAIPDEWGALARGEAGPGWIRTGGGFFARGKLQSPISINVQRFYGSVTPGPNSHFFTINEAEWNWLMAEVGRLPATQPRWHSEGSPFNVFGVPDGGDCGELKTPVYRAYNGGAARGLDSNHRFSTDWAAIEAVVREGWVAEGIAFCVDAQ